MKSAAAGCGGNVDLSSSTTASFKTQNGSTYESLEDCHWTVEASPGKNIKFTINSMDLKNATNRTFNHRGGNQCSGDYLEVSPCYLVTRNSRETWNDFNYSGSRWRWAFRTIVWHILWQSSSVSYYVHFEQTLDTIVQRRHPGRNWSYREIGSHRW